MNITMQPPHLSLQNKSNCFRKLPQTTCARLLTWVTPMSETPSTSSSWSPGCSRPSSAAAPPPTTLRTKIPRPALQLSGVELRTNILPISFVGGVQMCPPTWAWPRPGPPRWRGPAPPPPWSGSWPPCLQSPSYSLGTEILNYNVDTTLPAPPRCAAVWCWWCPCRCPSSRGSAAVR